MGSIASYLRKLGRRRPQPPPVQPSPPAVPEVPDGWIAIRGRGTHNVAPPKFATHLGAMPYLSTTYNHPGMSVLEVGARVVTGANYRAHFANARYVGFDFYEGPNVDIAGDAHRLSTYFGGGERFDLIYSLAVLEHLYAPWLVAEEIARLLKVGGRAYIDTTFSFSAHERPWNFFQFSDYGLRVLFNRGLGFEIEDIGMSNPIVGCIGDDADEYLRRLPLPDLYTHSSILVRKTRDVDGFDWRTVDLDEIVDGGARYPRPRAAE